VKFIVNKAGESTYTKKQCFTDNKEPIFEADLWLESANLKGDQQLASDPPRPG